MKDRHLKEETLTIQILQTLAKVFIGVSIIFDVWVVASWIDVIIHNAQHYPIYQFWNFFNLFL